MSEEKRNESFTYEEAQKRSAAQQKKASNRRKFRRTKDLDTVFESTDARDKALAVLKEGKAENTFLEAMANASAVKVAEKQGTFLSRVAPLPVEVIGETNDEKLGECAVCKFVSKKEGSGTDSPVIIYVPYEKFTNITDEDREKLHIPSRRRLIKDRILSNIDVYIEDVHMGGKAFIGNRLTAMETKKLLWFKKKTSPDGKSERYVLEKGMKIDARLLRKTATGGIFEFAGVESFVPIANMDQFVKENSSLLAGERRAIITLTNIERNAEEKTVLFSAKPVFTFDENSRAFAASVQKGMKMAATVTHVAPEKDKPYIFARTESGPVFYCPLTVSVSPGDKVLINCNPPHVQEDGEVRFSGNIEYVL